MKLLRLLFVLLLLLLAALGWKLYGHLGPRLWGGAAPTERAGKGERPAPVQVAPIEQGPIALVRDFSGTLEASAEFVAAPKISGLLQELAVNLGDAIQRGQLLARLDSAEYIQAVAQAEAELAVAQANLAEARSLLRIAERELQRIDQLSERGVSSASQRDLAEAEQLARQAGVQVTLAQLAKAEAQLRAAQIRLDYTQLRANWPGDDGRRLVAERYVDEGETVAVNAPLLRIVKLDPIIAVLHVTERDYAELRLGQAVSLATDAYPQRAFSGQIRRIAPVFREASRQARIEVEVANAEGLLKPGMFVRAQVVLKQLAQAWVAPAAALTRRDGVEGLFVLSADRNSVRWQPVQAGIQQGERLQVSAEGLNGDGLDGEGAEVVTLGQQLLKDGSQILLPEAQGRKDE
ncbi:MAG: efflux RND transporter periplasmic adaptor subunit [Gammaproteobacteria bacterium SHHR-1]|uniref:efflux RND transporter periplasmic adaptor subunit n=1 Tax=Magnetovirga frankeli TaxID=947516 RepID=UPI001293CF76|nr:efflux RND transporter periplasmic adaptor subunit [gamma proteobacterium SS-5]